MTTEERIEKDAEPMASARKYAKLLKVDYGLPPNEVAQIEADVREGYYQGYELGKSEQLKQERNKAIDEIQTKGMELAKVLRNADPVMFPTLVIRAEAIEDFCKTLTAHGEQ